MFPSNLHKNIIQLDRQISLLENECKNMEIDKRKRGFRGEPPYGKCSKISSLQVKASPGKATIKNTNRTDCSKRNKKLTSPVSERLHPSSTLQSPCSQPWSDPNGNIARKTKICRLNANVPVCSCQNLNGNLCNQKKKNKCPNSDFGGEVNELNLCKGDHCESCQQDQVLHKELLFSKAGSTIEVTVTQKSSGQKEISPHENTYYLEDKLQKDRNCKCQAKGQKWSEILSSESSKKKSVNKENINKSKLSGGENKAIDQPLICQNNTGYVCSRSQENINDSNNVNNLSIQEENFEVPVKLSSPSHKVKNQAQIKSSEVEKDIQCILESIDGFNTLLKPKDSVRIIQHLVSQLKQKPINEAKQSSDNKETPVSVAVEKLPDSQNFGFGDTIQKNISLEVMKVCCENLIKDKDLLVKELATKDTIIATMNKREEEYLSLISSLKLNLEKTKENAQESIAAMKEINILKHKLLEKIKFSDTFQKNFSKAHDLLERYILENEKLKTEIKILTLEAQKHKVLLAGKEAEISKYKEEIQNFQRQVSDHLAVLKSNAQEIDIEKMMESIFHQSQIFLQIDLDSVMAENDQKDTSKTQNALMHSSPTSTKTSVVNSSWKQISSIHDSDESNANPELNLNDDHNAKDFFQIFGDNLSLASKSSKKSKQTLVENLVNGSENLKGCLSFASCMSAHDEQDSNSGSNNDASSISTNDETLSDIEKAAAKVENSHRVSFERAQSNVEEVLKNMKLKLSKKIFETSIADCTMDDFLDSQISSISQ